MTPAGHRLALDVLPTPLAIVRLAAGDRWPSWIERASWVSVTRTGEELSVVCESGLVPSEVLQSGPWRALRVRGPLDFQLTGILRMIAGPLADAQISIFAVSTYDTDYVLVAEEDLGTAIARLREEGMVVHAGD